MGGLVRTKGTLHLVDHFNKEFRGNKLDDLRTKNIDLTTTPIKSVFEDAAGLNLLELTTIVKHSHSHHPQKKCLLPDSFAGHNHLEKRWLYFLGNHLNVLQPANHIKIRRAIYKVLDDNTYDHIEFDCIETLTQDVLWADEYDNSGAHPDKYLRLVLATPRMD